MMFCNVSVAETMEELLNDRYKITKEELVIFKRNEQKIFTLKKGKDVKVCTVT